MTDNAKKGFNSFTAFSKHDDYVYYTYTKMW